LCTKMAVALGLRVMGARLLPAVGSRLATPARLGGSLACRGPATRVPPKAVARWFAGVGTATLGLSAGTYLYTTRTVRCSDGDDTPPEPTLFQKCVAEAIGTGVIVGGGCTVVSAMKYAGAPIGPLAIALGFGGSVMMAVYATRDVSGAHLNPAVTAALAVNRPEAVPTETIGPYMLAQLVGATLAGALNYATYRGAIIAAEAEAGIIRGTTASMAMYDGAFGMLINRKFVRTPGAFLVEFGATAALAFMIFTITDPAKSVPDAAGPALVGGTVATLILGTAPLTGCGMNPARDLGPRLVTALAGWGSAAVSPGCWVYVAGPIAGAVAGGALYNALH